MLSITKPTYMFIGFILSLLSTVVRSQTSTVIVTPIPTPDPFDPAAPQPDDPNDTTGWSVVIIDKQWTQLCIGMLPIVAAVVVLSSLYRFVWFPWWHKKMKQVEKEYDRLEKARLGVAGRA
ncbi:hypothetical protein BDZ91DRAFT_801467 [Kalaharituber pfeilii]|nr:hypothetical protein BDZ91DRAFT_801467 [Kalaharituber pfeilii]